MGLWPLSLAQTVLRGGENGLTVPRHITHGQGDSGQSTRETAQSGGLDQTAVMTEQMVVQKSEEAQQSQTRTRHMLIYLEQWRTSIRNAEMCALPPKRTCTYYRLCDSFRNRAHSSGSAWKESVLLVTLYPSSQTLKQ